MCFITFGLYGFYYFVSDAEDIIEEALMYFKANVFFKNYEVRVSEFFYVRTYTSV